MNRKNIPFSIFLIAGLLLPLSISSVTESANVYEQIEMTFAEPVSRTQSYSVEGYTDFFISNNGQIENDDVLLYTANGPVKTGFRENGITIAVETEDKGFSYDIDFLGGSSSGPEGMEELDHHTNYFSGSDPDDWHTNVENFENIIYENVWENIDIVYRIVDGRLKYDTLVHPGGNVKDVVFSFQDVSPELIDGALLIRTPIGDIFDDMPLTYQSDDEITSSWSMMSDSCIGFEVGQYDPDRELVIDPGLSFSSYAGGSNLDRGRAIVVDSQGYSYIAGYTASNLFPTTTGAYDTSYGGGNNGDAFVMKVNISGDRLIYSTYLGGSGSDYGMSIDVDSSGNAYIGGQTYSNNFPTQNAYDGSYLRNGDAFVTKLSPRGNSLVYSTYLGGYYKDEINGLKVNSAGNAFVTGRSAYVQWQGYRYPTTYNAYDRTPNGDGDIVVTKLATNGMSLVYSTFIGSNDDETGYGIDLDSSGNAYITGETRSSNFPTTSGAYDRTYGGSGDCFVVKLSSSGGSLSYSTFFGGSSSDTGYSLVLDRSNQAHITGQTDSSSFPTTNNAYDSSYAGNTDAFISVISSNGATMMNSTFVGGSGTDVGRGIAYGPNGMVYITGHTASSNYPTTSDAYSTSNSGNNDVFVTKMNMSGGGVIYSTYIGGSNNEEARGIYVDDDGLIYVAGETNSNNYPTSLSAFDRSHNSNDDVFFTKFYPADFKPSGLTTHPWYFHVNLTWSPPGTFIIDGYKHVGYRIYRGLSTSSMKIVAEIGNVTYYNDTINYFVSREYQYFVTALFETIGEGKETNTARGIPMVTPIPSDPVASPGDLCIDISWNKLDQFCLDTFEIDYILYRGLSTNYLAEYARLGEMGNYMDSGLPPIPRDYFYSLSYEIKGVGESNMSNIIMATPNTPPSGPSIGMIETLDSGFDLSWEAPERTGGYPIEGYELYRGPSEDALEEIRVLGQDVVNFTDSGLEPGTTYYYSISALNSLGSSIPTMSGPNLAKTVPSKPLDLATIGSSNTIDLEWSPPINTWNEPIEAYNIYKIADSGSFDLIGTTGPQKTRFTDNGENGVIANYSVSAVNFLGEGDMSDVIEGMAVGVPGKVNVIEAVAGNRQSSIYWETVASDGGSPVTRYSIYRSLNIEDPQMIANTSSGSDSFTDLELTNGESYYYRVTAWNINGEGEL
ncbi:MAG: SBBP repeat-containing protein, partial [Candidatus Thermoplasmatota archaeon]|nr:SBBP repeat-containing protein [Candidatus Thermoplasmatota archaeon]